MDVWLCKIDCTCETCRSWPRNRRVCRPRIPLKNWYWLNFRLARISGADRLWLRGRFCGAFIHRKMPSSTSSRTAAGFPSGPVAGRSFHFLTVSIASSVNPKGRPTMGLMSLACPSASDRNVQHDGATDLMEQGFLGVLKVRAFDTRRTGIAVLTWLRRIRKFILFFLLDKGP